MGTRATQARKVRLHRELNQSQGWTQLDDPFFVYREHCKLHRASDVDEESAPTQQPDDAARPNTTDDARSGRARSAPSSQERLHTAPAATKPSPAVSAVSGTRSELTNPFSLGLRAECTTEQLKRRTAGQVGTPRAFESTELPTARPRDVQPRLKDAVRNVRTMMNLSAARSAHRTFLETLPSHRRPQDIRAFVNALGERSNKFIRLFQREQQERLARTMMFASAGPGAVLFGPGEPADMFYTILRGSVQIERQDAVCKLLKEGDFFGEEALMEGKTTDRRCKVKVMEAAEFATLKRDAFNVALAFDDDLVEKVEFLKSTPVLSHCASDYLVHLAVMSEFVTKEAGDYICRQAADALELFIVVSGRCALEVKFDFVRAAGRTSTHSHHLALSTVGEGELIGDIELINEVASGYLYTARALTHCRLLRFRAQAFAENMTTSVFEAMRLHCRVRSQWRNRRMTVQLGILARTGLEPVAERFCFEPEIPLSTPAVRISARVTETFQGTYQVLSASSLPNDLIEPLTAGWDKDGVSRVKLRQTQQHVEALKQGSNKAGAMAGKWSLYRYGPWATGVEATEQRVCLLEALAKRATSSTEQRNRRDAIKEMGSLLELAALADAAKLSSADVP